MVYVRGWFISTSIGLNWDSKLGLTTFYGCNVVRTYELGYIQFKPSLYFFPFVHVNINISISQNGQTRCQPVCLSVRLTGWSAGRLCTSGTEVRGQYEYVRDNTSQKLTDSQTGIDKDFVYVILYAHKKRISVTQARKGLFQYYRS